MKISSALSFGKLLIILVFIAMIVAISAFALMVLPLNNVQLNTLRAKVQLPVEVKSFPVLELCSPALYTQIIPDCGAGACPTIYEIRYETRAKKDMISDAIENYTKSLDKPFEYTLELNSEEVEGKPCSDVLVELFSSNY